MTMDAPNRKIVGSSQQMSNICQQISTYCSLAMPVVIEGETGVGKTLVAHAIHLASDFSSFPFITIMCGHPTENTNINSLLQRDDMAQQAKDKNSPKDGGISILFEELGDLSDSMQIQIANHLDDSAQVLHRKETKPSFRTKFIFTTTTPFSDLLEKGHLRPDLFYRLGAFTLPVPSLRQRKGDIPELCEYFLSYYSELQNKPILRLSASVLEMLIRYDWPGNVRQLENIIEFAVVTDKDELIGIDDLPKHFQVTPGSLASAKGEKGLKELVEEYEKRVIQDAFKITRGSISTTADYLKTTERIIRYKLHKYGIEPRSFK